jgi:hypothetical protein
MYRTAPRNFTPKPATTSQKSLIRKLTFERVVDTTDMPDLDTISMKDASFIIEVCLKAPKKPQDLAEMIAPGHYHYDGRVVLVQPNKAGTATYAKALVNGKWVYEPGLIGQLKTGPCPRLTRDEIAALPVYRTSKASKPAPASSTPLPPVCQIPDCGCTGSHTVTRDVPPPPSDDTDDNAAEAWLAEQERAVEREQFGPAGKPAASQPANARPHDCEQFDGECLSWPGFHGNPMAPAGAPKAATVRKL